MGDREREVALQYTVLLPEQQRQWWSGKEAQFTHAALRSALGLVTDPVAPVFNPESP